MLGFLALALVLVTHHLGHRLAARVLKVPVNVSAAHGCCMPTEAPPRSLGRRMALALSGSLANYLVAIVPLTGLFALGSEGPSLTVESVEPGFPAAAAGIVAGDTLVRLDGAPLESFGQLRDALAAHPAVVNLEVRRGAETRAFTVTPTPIPGGHFAIGIRPRIELTRPGLWGAFAQAHLAPPRMLAKMFDPVIETVGGPVMLYQAGSRSSGFSMVALLLALWISVAIYSGLYALAHLLPLPGLDGALLAAGVREALGGAPPDFAFQARARKKLLRVALILFVPLLCLLSAAVFKNDLTRLLR